jgi:hypothetical protein
MPYRQRPLTGFLFSLGKYVSLALTLCLYLVTLFSLAALSRWESRSRSAAAPNNLSALPREMLPLAISVASASKARSLASGDISPLLSPKGGTRGLLILSKPADWGKEKTWLRNSYPTSCGK